MTGDTVVFGLLVGAIALAAGLNAIARALLALAQTLNRFVLCLLIIVAAPHFIGQQTNNHNTDQREATITLV
jgi:hypothetical protein